MHLLLRFLVVTCLVKIAELCTLGNYDRCHPWGPCSEPCGGGTRHRICESCFFYIDKDVYGKCNEKCYNDGNFVSGHCQCPSWRSGKCCEDCNHIYIAHCVGNKVCGGSPDGIKCTQCADPYYSAGYNRGCSEIITAK